MFAGDGDFSGIWWKTSGSTMLGVVGTTCCEIRAARVSQLSLEVAWLFGTNRQMAQEKCNAWQGPAVVPPIV